MKIVVITSSPHPHDESTSIYLADRFTKGAEQAGHEVFTFDAANSDTHPCRGCDQCHMDGPCIWKDDIENTLMPKMLEADLLVLTTPLYYYGMSAQLKTIVDRFYSRTGRLHGKKSILMVTAYNSADWTIASRVTWRADSGEPFSALESIRRVRSSWSRDPQLTPIRTGLS